MPDPSVSRSTPVPSAGRVQQAVEQSGSAYLPGGISGKRMTIVVLLTLLVTGVLFYWVTMAYTEYNAARRETDRTWRELAPELDRRYQAIDDRLARADETLQITPEFAQQWRETRDAFSRTSQALRQIQAAERLEALIATLPLELRDVQPPASRLAQLTSKYSVAAAKQRAVGATSGSRLLKLMLSLPEPTEFRLAE